MPSTPPPASEDSGITITHDDNTMHPTRPNTSPRAILSPNNTSSTSHQASPAPSSQASMPSNPLPSTASATTATSSSTSSSDLSSFDTGSTECPTHRHRRLSQIKLTLSPTPSTHQPLTALAADVSPNPTASDSVNNDDASFPPTLPPTASPATTTFQLTRPFTTA